VQISLVAWWLGWAAAVLYGVSLPLSATWDSVTPIDYVAALHAFGPTFDSGGIRGLTSVYTMILCGYAVRPLRWMP
jgi:hypothetical protein